MKWMIGCVITCFYEISRHSCSKPRTTWFFCGRSLDSSNTEASEGRLYFDYSKLIQNELHLEGRMPASFVSRCFFEGHFIIPHCVVKVKPAELGWAVTRMCPVSAMREHNMRYVRAMCALHCLAKT